MTAAVEMVADLGHEDRAEPVPLETHRFVTGVDTAFEQTSR